MNELSIAMARFWGGFVNILHNPPRKIPAYLEGYAFETDGAGRPVPPGFPYITYDMPRPSFGELAYGTASVWDRNSEPGWFNLVNNVLEQVEKAIPHEGAVLRLKNGTVWVLRGSGGFLSYMTDPGDTKVTRGIVSFGIRSFLI